jgi:alpha-L-arabinofuranosidase
VPALRNKRALAGEDSLYASAVIDDATGELIVKMVNVSAKAQSIPLNIEGAGKLTGKGTLTVLRSDEGAAMNIIGDSPAVSPSNSDIAVKNGKLTIDAGPYSFTILKVKLQASALAVNTMSGK